MKILLVLLISFFIVNLNSQLHSQTYSICDSVVMNDGTVEMVKVKELKRNKLIYFLCCENCAVPREKKRNEIDTIIYYQKKEKPQQNSAIEVVNHEGKTGLAKKEGIKRYSFYMEGTLPFGAWDYQSEDVYEGETYIYNHGFSSIGIGISLGNKWYFSNGERYKTGIIVNYARAEFTLEVWYLDPLHIGWANVWKRRNGSLAEFNLSGGPRLDFADFRHVGFAISPELKFRVKGALFGIAYDYGRRVYTEQYSFTRKTTNSHMLRFTAGFFK